MPELKLEVTNSPQSVHWEGYGLKLSIPPKSLPPDIKTCSLIIRVFFSSKYQFPENMELVSSVFLLKCEPQCTFARSLSLEIEHCALPENGEHLYMARALCTQKDRPYSFKVISGGTFTQHSSYGIIPLDTFSFLSVLQERIFGNRKRIYFYEVFYILHRTTWEIHFAITWHDSAHRKVSCI